MAASSQDQLCGEVARGIVAQLAPEELPLFRSLHAAYLRDPQTALRGKASTGGPLGFGDGGAAVALLTPIVLAVTQSVVTLLISEGTKAAAAESGDLIDGWVRSVFERKKEPSPALNAEQLERVRAVAVQNAARLGLPEEKAALLADAMVGGLTIESGNPS